MKDRRHIGIFIEGLSLTQCRLLGDNLNYSVPALHITLVSVIPSLPPRFYQLPEAVQQEKTYIHQALLKLAKFEEVFSFPVKRLLVRKTLPQAFKDCTEKGMDQLLVVNSLLPQKIRWGIPLTSVDAVLALPLNSWASKIPAHLDSPFLDGCQKFFFNSNKVRSDKTLFADTKSTLQP